MDDRTNAGGEIFSQNRFAISIKPSPSYIDLSLDTHTHVSLLSGYSRLVLEPGRLFDSLPPSLLSLSLYLFLSSPVSTWTVNSLFYAVFRENRDSGQRRRGQPMGSGNRCSFADTCHARRRTSFRAAYRQSFSSFSSFYHSISFVSLLFRFVSFRFEMGKQRWKEREQTDGTSSSRRVSRGLLAWCRWAGEIMRVLRGEWCPTKLQFGGCNSGVEKWPAHTEPRGGWWW